VTRRGAERLYPGKREGSTLYPPLLALVLSILGFHLLHLVEAFRERLKKEAMRSRGRELGREFAGPGGRGFWGDDTPNLWCHHARNFEGNLFWRPRPKTVSQRKRSRLEILLMSTFDTYESSDGRDGMLSYSAARLVSLGVLRTWWPWIYSRITGAASAEFIAKGSSKKQASTEAGVACSTFMRWQARKTSIRARVKRGRWDVPAETLKR
jgi:hypothetical protein